MPELTGDFEGLGLPSDPDVFELRVDLAGRGIWYDTSIDGRPAFMLTNSERDSILEFLGERAATIRFDFFGALGYMREINGETVFLILRLLTKGDNMKRLSQRFIALFLVLLMILPQVVFA